MPDVQATIYQSIDQLPHQLIVLLHPLQTEDFGISDYFVKLEEMGVKQDRLEQCLKND